MTTMQTNDEKKIANCPFCRSTAQLYIRNNQYTVRCNNHNCIAYDIEPHFISSDSAIAAWNASDVGRKIPTADVQEVRHGKWGKSLFAQDFFRCSLCSAVWNRKFEYCPHCGAKMDEEGNDEYM